MRDTVCFLVPVSCLKVVNRLPGHGARTALLSQLRTSAANMLRHGREPYTHPSITTVHIVVRTLLHMRTQ
jgi:hypothetical protein